MIELWLHNGGLIESHRPTWSIVSSFSMTLNDPKPRFQVRPFFDVSNSKMAKETAIVTMEGTVPKLSNVQF